MPQKILSSNAVCIEFSFSLFNLFNTINGGERDLVYITALLHPPFNTLTEKNKHLSSLCSTLAAPAKGWRQSLLGGRSGEPCVKPNAHVCGGQLRMCLLGDWCHWRLALCGNMEWLRDQSRARSGWVFSFSPFSSCFRVPASTTDWDLLIWEGRKKIQLQKIHDGNNFGIQILCSPY